MYNSIAISGTVADGYSTGDAIKAIACILPPPLVDMTNLLCLLSIFTVHSVNGRRRLYLYFSDFFVPANKKGRAAKRTRETPHLPPRKGADVVLTSEWSWNEDS